MKRVIKASSSLPDEYTYSLDNIIEDAREEIDWAASDQEIIDRVINDIVYSDYYWPMIDKSLAYFIQEHPDVIETYIVNYLH